MGKLSVEFKLPRRWAEMPPGSYGKGDDGRWWVKAPTGAVGPLDERWTVVEHDDGTITVKPSINIPECLERRGYHGFLTRGEWS